MEVTFDNLSLILWAACPPLFVYGLFRRIERLQCATVIVFFLLLVDVFIGLNRPNPDMIRIVEVVIP